MPHRLTIQFYRHANIVILCTFQARIEELEEELEAERAGRAKVCFNNAKNGIFERIERIMITAILFYLKRIKLGCTSSHTANIYMYTFYQLG